MMGRLADAPRGVAEMARVARSHLLVSVPREPLWRGLNVARGAYIKDLQDKGRHENPLFALPIFH